MWGSEGKGSISIVIANAAIVGFFSNILAGSSISYFASKYVRFVLRIPVFDTTAGFVCFSRKVLEEIGLDQIKMTGYGFQVEMKYRAFRKKFQIAEVPIIFTDRTQGESKMNGGIIKEAVFGVIDLKLKSLFGKL